MMKAGVPPRTQAPSVHEAHLAAAIVAVKAKDLRQKEQVCDRGHAEQPNLLTSVLVLPEGLQASRLRRRQPSGRRPGPQ